MLFLMCAFCERILSEHAASHGAISAALEDIEDHMGALKAYSAAVKLDPSHYDALCAKVFLSHFLCAWKGWKDDLRLLEATLRGPVLERRGWGGTCDQPFRLFSYELPVDLAPRLTAHVISKEAHSIPREQILVGPDWPRVDGSLPGGGLARVVCVGYMSSDFGSHTVSSPRSTRLYTAQVCRENRVSIARGGFPCL